MKVLRMMLQLFVSHNKCIKLYIFENVNIYSIEPYKNEQFGESVHIRKYQNKCMVWFLPLTEYIRRNSMVNWMSST